MGPGDPPYDLDNALESAVSKDAALQLVLAAAERSMADLRLTTDVSLRKTKGALVKQLLDRAERIKVTGKWTTPLPVVLPDLPNPKSTRKLSKTEQILLLKASLVNGSKYPPWQSSPLPTEFDLSPDGAPFTDDYVFQLSSSQNESLLAWKRAKDALPPPSWHSSSPTPIPATSPVSAAAIDLVQDAATDCSLVASMCAAVARTSKGYRPLLETMFNPFNTKGHHPLVPLNGKYIARLNFNGTFRRVVIDDALPVSKTQRIIHVFDRNNLALIWPALLEKMYLKIFGGYDFPGSNSATDLWILFGWIPEQVFFSSQGTSLGEIWTRIWTSHSRGNVMVTLGTGKMSTETERHVGLVSEHAYAVLDLREEDGQRLMLVKNPWCQGPTWKGSPSTDETTTSPRDLLNRDSQMSPGTFWMDIHSISQHFDYMYLNWHPGFFKFREDMHFSWELDGSKSQGTFIDTPQFILRIAKAAPTWLLLCRHIQSDSSRSKGDRMGFINLALYDGASKVILKEQPLESSPFVDSYQTLLCASELKPNTTYTVVPDQDDLPDPRHTFSISVFSNSQFTFDRAAEHFPYTTHVSGTWSEDTAGGNADSQLFSQNPQYSMRIARVAAVSILLETPNKTLPVNIKVCFSNGRVHGLRTRDIVADSNTYRPRCALTRIPRLDPGVYTIICSTFEPGQLGTFKLRLDSDIPISVHQLPSEGAGRLRTAITPASFGSDEQASAILLLPQRLTRFSCLVKARPVDSRQERSMVRVSVVQGGTYQYRVLASSSEGEFRGVLGGVRTDEVDLSPAMARDADLWLLVERSCFPRDVEDEQFEVEFFTDSKGAVQTGDWREWET